MSNIFEYKGYHTKVEYDKESMVIFGKIEGIKDLVTFETTEVSHVESEFKNAVDNYLQFCEEVNQNPNKEYKGSFNVRIAPDLHRELAVLADMKGCSLNNIVEEAIEEYVEENEHQKAL